MPHSKTDKSVARPLQAAFGCAVALGVLHTSLAYAQSEPRPALIAPDEGEQLTRRWGYPLTIKVDPLSTGSRQLIAGTEDIPPGLAIPRHRHTHSEEILYVQSGTVLAHVGDEERSLGAGSIAFAPPNTNMSFQNLGNTTATILWIFPQPGFEEYLRATSVPAGTAPTPLVGDELNEIRARYADHIVIDAGELQTYPTEAGRPLTD